MVENTIPIKNLSADIKDRMKKIQKKEDMWEAGQFGRELFEKTGECIFIIDMDLHYRAANQPALEMLGYTEDEFLKLSVGDVMSLGAMLEQSGQANIYERIFRRKDGSLIPVELSTSVILDQDGAPVYIQSIVRDISERKKTEHLLKRNALILSVISEATARLFLSSNIESKISELLELLGSALGAFSCVVFDINNFSERPLVDLRYQWVAEIIDDFDIAFALQQHVESLIAQPNSVFSKVDAGSCPSVSNYSLLVVPIQDTLGAWGFLGFFDQKNDLTWLGVDFDILQTSSNVINAALQRMRYEETIRLNEVRNRAIVDALPDLVMRINSEYEILDYSCSPEHPLYLHRDMISGKKLTEIWPEDIVFNIIGTENSSSFQVSNWVEGFRLPFSSGIYEARLHPIHSVEALIIIRDISDRIQLDEMKTDFINRASHELRTPLTSAILMADLIQQGGTREELEEYWQTLRKELNRQKNLIDRLLMAGRLESGTLKLEISPIELVSIVEESIQAVKTLANRKRVLLVLESPEKPLMVLGDKGALEQVFINLINNATKFSPDNSRINITVCHVDEAVEVHIQDHGMGIAADAVPHLFEKFYRAKNVTIAEISGSGIGLYIVKSIVDELGGMIDVVSELHKGTTFIVRLNPAK